MDKIITKSILFAEGNPARYRLQTKIDNLDKSKPYRKISFGDRNKKNHKTILLVGESGTGKSTLINVMINYVLGVKREDRVWFEITDDQSDQKQVHSQTSIITVYGFYPQQSPVHLTIIDTPGFGDTRGVDHDEQIPASLLSLSKSEEEIHEIHAVCLVIKATQNRLSSRQIYIFDSVQSLLGRDIAENIVLLFTHSDGMPPKNALTAVKEAKIKCAVNDKNEPVFFRFNNSQSDAADEEYEMEQKYAWDLSFKETEKLFKFLNTTTPKPFKMTQEVLQKRRQLKANICNLKLRVQMVELKKNDLKQTQAALEQNKELNKELKNNFEYEVDVPYKEKVDIDPALARMAMCCTVCEENCHYPGCWWASNLAWCSVMDKEGNCTVCTNKCSYSKHIKEAKIYDIKTKKERRTHEDSKKKYHDISDHLLSLNRELSQLNIEEVKLVMEAFYCVEILDNIALSTDSMLTLLHVDFLIKKLNDIDEPKKAKKLEAMRKGAGEKHRALVYMTENLNINK